MKRKLDLIDPTALSHARTQWQALIADYRSVIDVTEADFATATDLYRDRSFDLRAGDAFHVAIARRCDAILATLDRRMHEQARALNMRTADILPD